MTSRNRPTDTFNAGELAGAEVAHTRLARADVDGLLAEFARCLKSRDLARLGTLLAADVRGALVTVAGGRRSALDVNRMTYLLNLTQHFERGASYRDCSFAVLATPETAEARWVVDCLNPFTMEEGGQARPHNGRARFTVEVRNRQPLITGFELDILA